MQNVKDLEWMIDQIKEEVQADGEELISPIPEDEIPERRTAEQYAEDNEIIQEEENEPVKKETEIEMLLKKKKDDQLAYLLGEIEVLRNQQSVLENRIARYKKLKKV